MGQFEAGTKVRINEGLLEGQVGTVVKWGMHVTLVSLEDTAFGGGSLTFYTETLVSADEDHAALAHLKSLYPDFLKAPKSDNYRFRVTTFVDGIMYETPVPLDAATLVGVLGKPPMGLHAVEFMLKQNDPSRGLSWKVLWSE